MTTGRAHCLAHQVRKRCGKKKGESKSTLIARAAGGRHSLTTSVGWWEEAMYAGGARTSARDASPKVPRALNWGNPKTGIGRDDTASCAPRKSCARLESSFLDSTRVLHSSLPWSRLESTRPRLDLPSDSTRVVLPTRLDFPLQLDSTCLQLDSSPRELDSSPSLPESTRLELPQRPPAPPLHTTRITSPSRHITARARRLARS